MSLSQLITDIKARAKEHDFKVILAPSEQVIDKFQGKFFKDDGHFDEEDRVIKVATRGKISEWVPVLIHESCHMDQYLDDRKFYDRCDDGYNKFHRWIAKDSNVDEYIVRSWAMDIIALELDCEKRTVQKMKDYNIECNIPRYIRGANSYLFHFLFVAEHREYFGNYSSTERDITDNASSKFKSDYSRIPRRLHQAFLRDLRASK